MKPLFELLASADAPATSARRGRLTTPHGTVETPAFMPVATRGLMRGPWHHQLRPMGVEMMLANSFHLFVRPGVETVLALGGLHAAMGWDGPVLTDSGGFQAFSLAKQTTRTATGFAIEDPVRGGLIDWTLDRAFEVQAGLAPDIAMVLDVCPSAPLERSPCAEAVATTIEWARRQRELHEQRGGRSSGQAQFGIVQGGVFADLREECARGLTDLSFDGYAIGGVSVGEGHSAMMLGVEASTPHLPAEEVRYLMGVGTPRDLLEAVARGIDLFDCVWPMRAGRFATALTDRGRLHLLNACFADDPLPLDPSCDCDACLSKIPRGTLRAGFKAKELLPAMMLATHNLHYIERLMHRVREAVEAGRFEELRSEIARAYPLEEPVR